MIKIRGKKWKDMSFYEKVVFMDKIDRWMLPVRIVLFPIAFLIKLYKWTYGKE